MKNKINPIEIIEDIDKISSNQKETFKFQNTIEPVLLEREDELWRIVKSRGNIKSSFWLDSKGMEVIFSDFFHRLRADQAMKLVEDKKKQINDVARNRMSVKEEWQNVFNCVVKVAFRKPVYAYYGIIGAQADDKINKLYDGGTFQYVVPRFEHYKEKKETVKIDDYIVVNEYKRLIDSSWFKRFAI